MILFGQKLKREYLDLMAIDGFEQLFLFKGKVKSVYDGDSLRADIDLCFGINLLNQAIRVNGIDTPEMRGKGVTKEEKVLAKAARDRVKELVGKSFWLESLGGGKKDKYGRILANIYTVKGEDVAKTLIQEGHAVAYDGGKKTHKWA
tara:strand:+ start:2066 stop:2506 length:441 start_codon:yes stop_codon:yes gene_type:complete